MIINHWILFLIIFYFMENLKQEISNLEAKLNFDSLEN